MKKIILYVIFGALLVGLYLSPLVERSSRIVRVVSLPSEDFSCLRIVKRQRGDITLTRPFVAKARFIKYEANAGGQAFSGSFSIRKYMSVKVQNKIKARISKRQKSCKRRSYDNDFDIFPARKRSEKFGFCPGAFPNDRHIMPKNRKDILLKCSYNSFSDKMFPNCSFNYYYDNWEFNISIPEKNKKFWAESINSVKTIFEESFELLPFCPIRIPLF